MWTAFKLLPISVKIGWLVGLLVAFSALFGSVAYTFYQKGLNVSKVEISQYETKNQELENKLVVANGKVITKVVDRVVPEVKYIEKVRTVNHETIKERVVHQFNLSCGWVYSYNQSVQGLEIDPVKAANATECPVAETFALDIINDNNGIALTNAKYMEALQAILKGEREAREEVISK
jgi:hypothetical protein